MIWAREEVGRKQIMDEFKELERQKDVCREILIKAVIAQAKDTQAKLSIVRKSADRLMKVDG